MNTGLLTLGADHPLTVTVNVVAVTVGDDITPF
jgi:hypothetical protein